MFINDLKEILSFSNDELIKENKEYNFNIHLLSASTTSNFKLLVTHGLSNTTQKVDEKNKFCEKIELYFCLPDYWNIEKETWPIEWLNKLAQIPQKNNTWYGIGDTIPAGKPQEYLSKTFKANHFILGLPIELKDYFSKDKWIKYGIQMLAVTPIFQDEVDFKLRNSSTILYKKLSKKSINEMVDPFRKSVCRKRILGLF